MYYTPIPSNGWSLAVLFPQDEFTADIVRLNRIVIILGVVGLSIAFHGGGLDRPFDYTSFKGHGPGNGSDRHRESGY